MDVRGIYESSDWLVLHIERCQSPVKIRHPQQHSIPEKFLAFKMYLCYNKQQARINF